MKIARIERILIDSIDRRKSISPKVNEDEIRALLETIDMLNNLASDCDNVIINGNIYDVGTYHISKAVEILLQPRYIGVEATTDSINLKRRDEVDMTKVLTPIEFNDVQSRLYGYFKIKQPEWAGNYDSAKYKFESLNNVSDKVLVNGQVIPDSKLRGKYSPIDLVIEVWKESRPTLDIDVANDDLVEEFLDTVCSRHGEHGRPSIATEAPSTSE